MARKKTLIFAMVLTLVLVSLLAACGGAATTPAPATTSAAPATTSAAPATTSKAPATTSAAPATTSKAPATTSAAPATTSKAPATTSAAPATTSAAPATTSAAPAGNTITWEQALTPEYLKKTVTIKAKCVAVYPGWTTHLLISLGKEAPDGFDAEVYDPSIFPDKDLKAAWVGKTLEVTGKIEINGFTGVKVLNIMDPSQVKVVTDAAPAATTAAPAATTTAPAATSAAPAAGNTITWEQALTPEYLKKTATIRAKCVAVYPGWTTHLLVSLGKEAPDGFDAEVYDPSIFPDKDLKAAWVGHTLEVTGKIEINGFTGVKVLNIMDPSQVKVVD